MSTGIWDDARRAFEWDGSLRDVYVLGTTLFDWQRFLVWLPNTTYTFAFSLEGVEQPLPLKAAEVFQKAREATAHLAIEVGGIQINCHFFVESEIELDIDPRQIDANRFRELLRFLGDLGTLLSKDVRLTGENDPNNPFLVYDHRNRRVVYHSV